MIAALAMGMRLAHLGHGPAAYDQLTVYHWGRGLSMLKSQLRGVDIFEKAATELQYIISPCLTEDGRDGWREDIEARVRRGAPAFGMVTHTGMGAEANDILGDLDVLAPMLGDTLLVLGGMERQAPQDAYRQLHRDGWSGVVNGRFAFLQRPPFAKE